MVPQEPTDASLVDDQLVVVGLHEVGVVVVPAHRIEGAVDHRGQDHHNEQRPEREQTPRSFLTSFSPAGSPTFPTLQGVGLAKGAAGGRGGRGGAQCRLRLRIVTGGGCAGIVTEGTGLDRHHRRGRADIGVTDDHVDQDGGDVVASPMFASGLNQLLHRLLGVVGGGQDLGDLVVAQLVGEPVTAQQVPITLFGANAPEVGSDLRRDAQRPGQDVPVRMDHRFGRCDLAIADHLLGQAVIGGDLGQLTVVESVRP